MKSKSQDSAPNIVLIATCDFKSGMRINFNCGLHVNLNFNIRTSFIFFNAYTM